MSTCLVVTGLDVDLGKAVTRLLLHLAMILKRLQIYLDLGKTVTRCVVQLPMSMLGRNTHQ